MNDLLTNVVLSPVIVQAYHEFVGFVADAIEGVDPKDIPDEQAEQQADGSLLIYVDLPGARAEFVVPAGHWSDRRWN